MAKKKIQVAVILAAVLLAGAALGAGVSRLTGGPQREDAVPSAAGVSTAGDPDAQAALPQLGAPILPMQATSPELAVTGFLTAEAHGDFTGSYGFLAAEDRNTFHAPGAWVQAHGSFPAVTGFRIEGAVPRGEGVHVTTLTGYRPGLDEVLGLVTARARSDWMTVQEGGVWRVVFSKSADQPLYPGDASVTQVARRWAQRRIACQPSDELEASLKGSPFLARGLCQAKGELQLGSASLLSQLDDTTPFISAYGPDVLRWARTVPITAPHPMQIVLAPIDADWKVIGVIRQDIDH